MKRRNSRQAAFTLVELLVVIAIIALLVAMLVPSLDAAKQIARKIRCLAHLGQLAVANAAYASDHELYLPGPGGIVDLKQSNSPWARGATYSTETGLLHQGGYLQSPKIWLCPSVELSCPGIFYNEVSYPGWYGGPHWTAEEIRDYPYTYHFTINMRTALKQVCDTWRNGTPLPAEANGSKWATDAEGRRTYQRRTTSFGNLSRVILLAEENTGKVPWDGLPYGVGSEVVNDPYFQFPDVTEPRHGDKSMAGYLDGHATEIPGFVNLELDTEYWPVQPTD